MLADHIKHIPRVVPDADVENKRSGVYSIEMQLLHEVMEENVKQRKHRHPPYVLLVEDDSLTRRLVAHVLKYDYRLVTAHTAEEALNEYLLYAPDIVFLDINLPDGNGFEVMSKILEHDPQACIVMFSSDGQMETILDATHQGASGFVTKPFTKEQLVHYIQKAEHQKAANALPPYNWSKFNLAV